MKRRKVTWEVWRREPVYSEPLVGTWPTKREAIEVARALEGVGVIRSTQNLDDPDDYEYLLVYDNSVP